MPDVMEKEELYLSTFRELEKKRAHGEPTWLRRAREEAIHSFTQLGFPTTQMEEWKYTNVAPIVKTAFRTSSLAESLAEPKASPEVKDLEASLWMDAKGTHLVFVNGRFSSELSSLGALPAG